MKKINFITGIIVQSKPEKHIGSMLHGEDER
jgi:hypothetical protein